VTSSPASSEATKSGESSKRSLVLRWLALAATPLLALVLVQSLVNKRPSTSRANTRFGLIPAESMDSPPNGHTLVAGDNSDPLRDEDGDLLPDALEWVLFSDPTQADADHDTVDDFMEAIQYTSPRHANSAQPAAPRCRVLVNTTGDATNRRFWLHLLAQLPTGKLSDFKGLSIFLTVGQHKVYLDPLLFLLFAQVQGRLDAKNGYLVRVSFELPIAALMSSLKVTTFGAKTLLGSQQTSAATLLLNLGTFHSVSVFNNNKDLALTTAGPLENENPYWSINKICVMEMSFQGLGPGWLICEVDSADCELESGGRCASNCATAEGLTFFLPDGLQLVGN